MNVFNFIMADAIATLVLAYMGGWAVAVIIWILRFLVIDLPHAGLWKGGE